MPAVDQPNAIRTETSLTLFGWLTRLYHRLGSPPWFYRIAGLWIPWFAGFAALTLSVGTIWALGFAPVDYQQGDSYRIMYVHVPAAALGQSAYLMMGVAGLVLLVWRMKLADVFIVTVAPVGAAFIALAVITGTVYGMPTWGIGLDRLDWLWDGRILSTIVLFFLYLGVIALRRSLPGQDGASRAAALLAVVGTVNIPVIKYSVEWWLSLHQPASFTLTERPAMPFEMWAPMLLMALGFYALFAVMVLAGMRSEVLARESHSRWVQELAGDVRGGGETTRG